MYLKGIIPGIAKPFGYVGGNGANWDATRILFYAKSIFQYTNTGQFFDGRVTNSASNLGFNFEGSFNKMSFLSQNIRLAQINIQEVLAPNLYQKIKLLDIDDYYGFPKTYESVFCLGITQAEFTVLKNSTGLSNKHHSYPYLEQIGGILNDKDDKPYQKFKLKLQGLDNNGNSFIAAPATDIYVYTNLGLVFASKDFAAQETSQLGIVYKRNYEENVGYANIEPTTQKHYEDYFIENINPNMKTEVDGFINALSAIAINANTYSNIKTLVEDNAKDIWTEAVSFVQANANTTPDDRPLYWARNKMQVALKSHPYFENQFRFSEVLEGSELDKMIRLFEEKSRNYTGVDFSGAPAGAKKILITGFDPFQLESNTEQWNPSGMAILALHGKLINNTLIQAMVFPVRYKDFDNGYLEKYIFTHIANVDMVVTISQGAYRFDIERFASKYRTKTSKDNLNIKNVNHIFYLSKGNEIVKSILSNIPEFLQTTLPISSMIPGTLGNTRTVYNQEYLSNLSSQEYSNPNSGINNLSGPGLNEIAVNGSGGDYLSNEIFFRVAVLRNHLGLNNTLKSGHLHVPILEVNNYSLASSFIIETTKILKDAIQGL